MTSNIFLVKIYAKTFVDFGLGWARVLEQPLYVLIDICMSPVSPVFHTVVTMSWSKNKNVTSSLLNNSERPNKTILTLVYTFIELAVYD